MRIRIHPARHFNAAPDPACHFDPDPTFHSESVLDPSFLSKKCSNRLIFHTFRRVICKLMRNRLQLSLRCRSRLALCWECGSGSATTLVLTRRTRQENVDIWNMDSGRLIGESENPFPITSSRKVYY
jgi:hypothetical protein